MSWNVLNQVDIPSACWNTHFWWFGTTMEIATKSIACSSSTGLALLSCDSFHPDTTWTVWEGMNFSVYQHQLWFIFSLLYLLDFILRFHYLHLRRLNIFLCSCSSWVVQNISQGTLSFIPENAVWTFTGWIEYQHWALLRWKEDCLMNIWSIHHLGHLRPIIGWFFLLFSKKNWIMEEFNVYHHFLSYLLVSS